MSMFTILTVVMVSWIYIYFSKLSKLHTLKMCSFPAYPLCPNKAVCKNRQNAGISLVAQWLRTRLPTQGTQVRALVREDPTCPGATKPVHHNYWACALELASHNYWAHMLQLLKPTCPRARAPQQEEPPQWEDRAPQGRVAPLTATRESPHTAMKTQHSQK